MARQVKSQMIPLDQIENRFDVRTKLDDDRVIQFAGCYESGIELPPVQVVRLSEDHYAYVDGRHRGAARAFCDFKEVDAVIIDNPNDPAELFAQALQANWGGSKPPTRDDITHTIIRMLELKATQSALRERLSFLPTGALRAYIASARSTIMKRRISKALDAIGEGSTIEEAGNQFAVPVDSLRDVVQGKKGKWGASRSTEVEFATAMKQHISVTLRSVNTSIAKKMEQMLARVDEGEMSYKEAYGVLKAWGDHLRKTGIRIADWKARLNAIAGETDKAAPEARAGSNDEKRAVA